MSSVAPTRRWLCRIRDDFIFQKTLSVSFLFCFFEKIRVTVLSRWSRIVRQFFTVVSRDDKTLFFVCRAQVRPPRLVRRRATTTSAHKRCVLLNATPAVACSEAENGPPPHRAQMNRPHVAPLEWNVRAQRRSAKVKTTRDGGFIASHCKRTCAQLTGGGLSPLLFGDTHGRLSFSIVSHINRLGRMGYFFFFPLFSPASAVGRSVNEHRYYYYYYCYSFQPSSVRTYVYSRTSPTQQQQIT